MTARSFGRGKTSTIQLGAIFSPLALVLLLYVPVLVVYTVSNADDFATSFDSRKTLTWTGLAFFTLALLCFAAGAKVGADLARDKMRAGRPGTTGARLTADQRRSLTVLLEAALVLSIVAYVVWFARGVIRAGGIIELFEIWRRDPDTTKSWILTTLPGVTTLTQLAVAAIPLAVVFGLARRGSVIRVLIFIVFALAATRAVLYNERLALIELVLPLLFLALLPRKVTAPRVAIYAAVFVVAAVTFFAATELRRSFVYTDNFSTSRATTRFLGYYLTSVNNGIAVVDEYPARTPFYSSGEFLWRFPGVRELRVEDVPALGTISFRYQDAFGVDPEHFWRGAFAEQGLDYEFNVFTGPGFLAADFGWAGLLGVFVVGLVSGGLYRRCRSSPFSRAFYAVWLVGLFEFMRILYFTDVRLFPAYLVFLAAYLVVKVQPGQQARLTTQSSSAVEIRDGPGAVV